MHIRGVTAMDPKSVIALKDLSEKEMTETSEKKCFYFLLIYCSWTQAVQGFKVLMLVDGNLLGGNLNI